MNDARESLTRRHFLRTSLHGIGGVALASMFARESFALGVGSPPFILPHFPPRAKRIICLWQGGGPSHVDLLDPKPELARFQGQDIPESVRGATRLSTMSSGYARWPALPAIRPFRKCGASGTEISELLPHIGESPTNSASCARCTPRPSTTRRA